MPEISDDAKRNRASWTKVNAEFTDRQASTAWAATEMTWGVFGVPEASINTLGDVNGLDVVELGCGTAYVSAWLAKRGARPVGVDVTPAQLATARRCQDEFAISFPLIEASAEVVPLPSESFDLAISEFGASIWCDRIYGYRRRIGCCARAVAYGFSATARCRSCVQQMKEQCPRLCSGRSAV